MAADHNHAPVLVVGSGGASVTERASRRRCSWQAQLGLFAAAYGLYTAARWLFIGDADSALSHAHWIVEREEQFGVAVEGSVQQALGSGASIWVLNHIYLAAQLVVLPSALIYLYKRNRSIYRGLRNTLLAAWLLAIPIYALFPVSPPRLADIGLIDTVSAQSGVELTGRSTMFYNPLAAVPSLHVGFAAAIGLALAAAAKRPSIKALALLWGPAVALAVVATGNHYVFDILAGLAVVVAGAILAWLPGWLASQRVVGPLAETRSALQHGCAG